MKTFVIPGLLILFSLCSSCLSAQDSPPYPTPRWIPDRGFWIIENNINSPDTAIIRFYTNDQVQIYSEKLEGIKLNLKKRKTLMRLKKVLEQAFVAWENSRVLNKNSQLVRSVFKPAQKSW